MSGKRLRKARKLCQLSTLEVAEMINVGVTNIVNMERDVPHVLNEDYMWFFYEKHEKPPRYEGPMLTVAQLHALAESEANNE